MRPEYFDEIQVLDDFSVMAALRWDNLWSSTCPVMPWMEVLSMKTL